MLLDIGSYVIHWLMALFFFLLIPFPFFIKGMDGENLAFIKKLYRPILILAHIGLIGSAVTGAVLITDWQNWWTAAVLIVWIGIGAFLGLTAKNLRLSMEGKPETSLLPFSSLLTISILIMFLLKFSNWF
ncbi:hypothetical protein [Alteribacillus sp. HJP-4]|uniref:hypothetical protein n=1 Tax=Alteribacillus sp. HJP-4 TaxID=2775394 RepID=UPI0035CD022A